MYTLALHFRSPPGPPHAAPKTAPPPAPGLPAGEKLGGRGRAPASTSAPALEVKIAGSTPSGKHAPSVAPLDPYLRHFLAKASAGKAGPAGDEGEPVAPADPGVSEEELGDWTLLEARLQKDLNALQDPDAGTRRRAMERVGAVMRAAAAGPRGGEVCADAAEGSAGRAVLRRFADPVERVREMAVECVASMLRAAPDAVMSVMPYLVPVLEERLVPVEIVAPEGRAAPAPGGAGPAYVDPSRANMEPSETVRRDLLALAVSLVEALELGCMAYAGELLEFVRVSVDDVFHEANEEACRLCVALTRALGKRLHAHGKAMVATMLPLTTHRRYRVRLAAIAAVRELMYVGAHEMILEMIAWRDPNQVAVKAFYEGELKVNFCGKLATDPVPQVREAFVDMVGAWLTSLDERKDHEERLLPYLLSSLNDDVPAVAERGAHWIDRLGALVEEDRAEELRDRLYYLDKEAFGLGWMPPHVVARLESRVYPHPLAGRPRLGARMVVQSGFNRTYFPICSELSSWQDGPRLMAAALLRTYCLFLEDYAARMLHKVVPAVTAAVAGIRREPGTFGRAGLSPDNARCLGYLEEACHLIGETTEPQMYVKLLLGRVGPANEDAGLRAAALEVLSWLLGGGRHRGDVRPHAPALLAATSDEALLRTHAATLKWSACEFLQSLASACETATDAPARWEKDPEEAARERGRRVEQRRQAAEDWERRRRERLAEGLEVDSMGANPYVLSDADAWIDMELYAGPGAGGAWGPGDMSAALRAALFLAAPAGGAGAPGSPLGEALAGVPGAVARSLEAASAGAAGAALGGVCRGDLWALGPGAGEDLAHSSRVALALAGLMAGAAGVDGGAWDALVGRLEECAGPAARGAGARPEAARALSGACAAVGAAGAAAGAAEWAGPCLRAAAAVAAPLAAAGGAAGGAAAGACAGCVEAAAACARAAGGGELRAAVADAAAACLEGLRPALAAGGAAREEVGAAARRVAEAARSLGAPGAGDLPGGLTEALAALRA